MPTARGTHAKLSFELETYGVAPDTLRHVLGNAIELSTRQGEIVTIKVESVEMDDYEYEPDEEAK